jgi:probable rRNA maturation factor
MDLEGGVGIRVLNDRSITELNRKFLGRKGATDVISFPSGEEDESGLAYLGDIAVGGRVAARAAEEAGQPLNTELRRLILHGLLHLVGYDHEADKGRMKRKENALRREFGLEP